MRVEDRLCPLARTFATTPAVPNCRGAECALYRVLPITTKHPLWLPAVRKLAEQTGEKPPYTKAARAVADDPAAYGMAADEGYCGLGGQP
jgi:hypothetical protein